MIRREICLMPETDWLPPTNTRAYHGIFVVEVSPSHVSPPAHYNLTDVNGVFQYGIVQYFLNLPVLLFDR